MTTITVLVLPMAMQVMWRVTVKQINQRRKVQTYLFITYIFTSYCAQLVTHTLESCGRSIVN